MGTQNKNFKILITGGSGLLGGYLVKILKDKYEIFAPSSKQMDVRNIESIIYNINTFKPNIVIHCAAISKFKEAEQRPYDTIDINIKGTLNIAQTCHIFGAKMIYISTSHVFDGKQGNYKTTDKINPISKYAKSKVAGEMITSIYDNFLIIRTEFCEENFPFERAYFDKYSSKEYIDIISPKIAEKCLSDEVGIIHIGGPRRSFYEFAQIRNPNIQKDSVKTIQNVSNTPILIDTSFKYDE